MEAGPDLWRSKLILTEEKCYPTNTICRGKAPQANYVTSNQTRVRENIVYSKDDDAV